MIEFKYNTVVHPETKKSRGDLDPISIKTNRKIVMKVRDTGYSHFIDPLG